MTYDATQVYALGADTGETGRLRRQSEELRPEALALLDRIGLLPGQAAIDLGCGPSGILDMLADQVGPGGHVVGLDANAAHVAIAAGRARRARRDGLANVSVMTGDARHTGLPHGTFDLVHARALLVTIPDPAEVVAEMTRLARPGGWIAGQEPDVGFALCHPPLAAWDRLLDLFRGSFGRSGADFRTGRRLGELFRAGGIEQVGVAVLAPAYPAGHSRRTVIPDLVRGLRPAILELGLAGDRELGELDSAVRRHLADPRTLMMPHLLMTAWGRKPSC